MTVDINIALPSLFSIITGIIASFLLFKSYQISKIKEFRDLSFAMFLLIPFWLNFFIFEFFKGGEYIVYRNLTGRITATLLPIGITLLWFKINSFMANKVPFRIILFIGIEGFVMGLYIITLQWQLYDSLHWAVHFKPFIGLVASSLVTIWLIIEILLLLNMNIKSRSDDAVFPAKMIYFGFLLYSFAIVFLIIERSLIGPSSINYAYIQSIGTVLMAIAFRNDILAVIPKDIGAKYFSIVDTTTGLTLIDQTFASDFTQEDKKLFSRNIGVILQLLREASNQDDPPKLLGFLNLSIIIEKYDRFLSFMIVKKFSNPIRRVSYELLRKIVENSVKEGILSFSDSELKKLKEQIQQVFSFAI